MNMSRLILIPAAAAIFAATAGAAEQPAASTRQYSLEECLGLALQKAPELGEAQADIDQTASKLEEARSYRYPQLDLLGLVGPAPQARRQDIFPTINTDKRFSAGDLTWFSSADATLIQPLYTFGKITENMKAATHGIEVDRARKQQRANEVALKVHEYYNGLLLARELKEVVLEVRESLTRARDKAQKLLDEGSESVDQSDIFKLDAFNGEAAKYLEEALKGERLALAALKTRIGLPLDAPFDIDQQRLPTPATALPPFDELVAKARARRPEFRQISEGLQARAALVEAARANYYPDIFLGGMFSWAFADDRDRIRNPYLTDRFNHTNGGVALGARWKLDFGITGAKVAGEQAQYNRLQNTRIFAENNIPLQIRKYYLDAQEAEQGAAAAKAAYGNAKKWAVTALANFDFGVGPARDIFEALQVYSRMRAAYFQALYNHAIARASLDYATGASPLDSTK